MEDLEQFKHYGRPAEKGINLHLGCGDYWYEGFINIDHATLGGTDMVWDLREKLPFNDNTVSMIISHDFIEHFTPGEVDMMLEDWKRVLIDEGMVIAVVPDIEELMKQGLVNQIYGIEHDHKWGYNQVGFEKLFTDHGFKVAYIDKKEYSYRPGEPKLEVKCLK